LLCAAGIRAWLQRLWFRFAPEAVVSGHLQLIKKGLRIDLRLTQQAGKGAHLDCSVQRYDAPSRPLAHHHMTAVLPHG